MACWNKNCASVKKKYLTLQDETSKITKVIKMNEILKQALLYDFYGELLTEHQKQIYEDVVFNDLTISEVAKEQGTSRQSVHDMVKRCDKLLEEYEQKLKLLDKFLKTREKVEEIHRLTKAFLQTGELDCIHRIEELSGQIGELE